MSNTSGDNQTTKVAILIVCVCVENSNYTEQSNDYTQLINFLKEQQIPILDQGIGIIIENISLNVNLVKLMFGDKIIYRFTEMSPYILEILKGNCIMFNK